MRVIARPLRVEDRAERINMGFLPLDQAIERKLRIVGRHHRRLMAEQAAQRFKIGVGMFHEQAGKRCPEAMEQPADVAANTSLAGTAPDDLIQPRIFQRPAAAQPERRVIIAARRQLGGDGVQRGGRALPGALLLPFAHDPKPTITTEIAPFEA